MKNIDRYEFGTLFSNNKYLMDSSDKGLSLYALYHSLMTKYIDKLVNLKEYDDMFATSDLNFHPVDENSFDIYQKLSSDELKYFYIRNNLYLDRLSDNEQKFLESKLISGNENLDAETIKFMSTTIMKVISESYNKDSSLFFYGPRSMEYAVPSDSIVIGFRYDRYYSEGMTDEEWNSNVEKQDSYKFDKLSDLGGKLAQIESVGIYLIEYNDYSITRCKNNNKSM